MSRFVFLAAFLIACNATAPDGDAGKSAPQDDSVSTTDAVAMAKARGAADQLAQVLGQHLSTALEGTTPREALGACTEKAQSLTRQVAEETGIAVGRTSLKLRNAANAEPAWAQAWLREVAGTDVMELKTVERVDDVDGKRVARLLRPLVIKAPCLACHGTEETLAEGVSEALRELRPDDQATGYAIGQLRGVIWAELPVSP